MPFTMDKPGGPGGPKGVRAWLAERLGGGGVRLNCELDLRGAPFVGG